MPLAPPVNASVGAILVVVSSAHVPGAKDAARSARGVELADTWWIPKKAKINVLPMSTAAIVQRVIVFSFSGGRNARAGVPYKFLKHVSKGEGNCVRNTGRPC